MVNAADSGADHRNGAHGFAPPLGCYVDIAFSCREGMGTAWVRFEYVAWFRDERLPPDDEVYEWPAVFVIPAPDQDHAKEWGDRLAAAQRALDTSEILIRSWTSPCPFQAPLTSGYLSSSTAKTRPIDVIGW